MPKHDDDNPSFGSKSFYIVYLKESLTILPTKIGKKHLSCKNNDEIYVAREYVKEKKV